MIPRAPHASPGKPRQPGRLGGAQWLLASVPLAALVGLVVALGTARAGSGVSGSGPDEAAHVEGRSGRLVRLLYFPWAARGYADPTPSFGVQLYNTENPLVLSRTVEAGARWIRIPFRWDWVEPDGDLPPDEYVWPEWFDQELREVADQGVQVMLTFSSNPEWAATYPNGPIDKVPIEVMAEFAAEAARHYAAPDLRVRHWELYNEPDNGFEGCAPPPTACGYWGYAGDEYAAMLGAVYPAVKEAEPAVQIAIGGLAYDRWDTGDPPGPFVEDFLDDVLWNEGGAHFDLMNFHYYPLFHWHWDAYGKDIMGKATYIRQRLASFGLVKDLICTETSMWSYSPDPNVPPSSLELQRRYVPQVLGRALASKLEITIWFMLADPPGEWAWKYGLVDETPGLNPKPAFYAYQVVADQLGGASFRRGLAGDSPEVEAYEFWAREGRGKVVVAWANSEGEYYVTLEATSVTVVDIVGNTTTLHDDDGDGRVLVPVALDAVYARY